MATAKDGVSAASSIIIIRIQVRRKQLNRLPREIVGIPYHHHRNGSTMAMIIHSPLGRPVSIWCTLSWARTGYSMISSPGTLRVCTLPFYGVRRFAKSISLCSPTRTTWLQWRHWSQVSGCFFIKFLTPLIRYIAYTFALGIPESTVCTVTTLLVCMKSSIVAFTFVLTVDTLF